MVGALLKTGIPAPPWPRVRRGLTRFRPNYQRKRLGELRLMNSIERVRRMHEHAGVVGLFVDAMDAHAAQFYARYGFDAFMDEPLKLFLLMKWNR